MKRRILTAAILVFFLLFPVTFADAAEMSETVEKTGKTTSQSEQIEPTTRTNLQKIRDETQEKLLSELDFGEMDKSLSRMFPDKKISFAEVMESLLEGNIEETGELLLDYIKDRIGYEFRSNRKSLIYMLLIIIVAAVFRNFASAMQSRQVSQISFYVLYMLLITLCLSAFKVAMEGLEGQLAQILDFMRLFCPCYFLAVTVSAGSSSAVMFYNLALFLIYLVEALILHFLLPVIHLYIMIQVINYLTGEDMLSEFTNLIQTFITWILKTLLGAVIGINVIQGLLGPAIDMLKRSTLTKTLEAIPGVGNTFGSVTDVALGTAVLVKNGIGMAGAVIVLLICVVPMIQMLVLCVSFKMTAALAQPISDERITGCIRSVGEGYALMIRTLFTVSILFLLTIAIAAAATS